MPIPTPATVYDPTRVIITFGLMPLIGVAPGRFVSVRRDVPVWSKVHGTNGELKRIRSRPKSGTVDVVLKGTSPANRALGVLMKVDEEHGTLLAPLAITDALNGGFFLSTEAYIEGFPEMSYGQQEGDVTWRFICDDLDNTYPGLSLETTVLRLSAP
jgi:hypothetical protein